MERWLSSYTRLFRMTEDGPIIHSDIALKGLSLKRGEVVFQGVLPDKTLSHFIDGQDWMVTYRECGDPFLFLEDEVIIRLLECNAKEIMIGQVTCLSASEVGTIYCDAIVQCEGGIEICVS